MGGAFAGLADDESALYYNPAGLSFLGHTGVQSLVEQRFGSATYGSFSIVGRYLGLGAVFITLPNLTQRDTNGQERGKFTYSSYGLTLALGSALGELPFFTDSEILKNLGVGLSLKIYGTKTLDGGNGSTLALDSSLLYRIPMDDIELVDELRVGLTLENVGPQIQYQSGHQESWKTSSRIGVGAKLLDRAFDITFDTELDGTVHMGSEYRLSGPTFSELSISQLGLRLGLVGGKGLFAFHVGLGFRLLNGLTIDYAFSLNKELPASHRLGASYRFDMATLFCTVVREHCYLINEQTQTRSYKIQKDPPQN
jgi:hypothetical protein